MPILAYPARGCSLISEATMACPPAKNSRPGRPVHAPSIPDDESGCPTLDAFARQGGVSFAVANDRLSASEEEFTHPQLNVTLPHVTTGLHRYHHTGLPHFITFSCVRHRPILGTDAARDTFCELLERTRELYVFDILGYAVMTPTTSISSSPSRKQNPSPSQSKSSNNASPKRAPNFTHVIDLDGHPVKIDPGERTLIYVFSPKCIWCKRNLSSIRDLASQLKRPYRVLGMAAERQRTKRLSVRQPPPFRCGYRR